MYLRTSGLAIVLALLPTASFAQHRGSAADQIACTPDVYRLCSEYIPDEDNIISCLQKRKAQLSPACGRVFSGTAPAKPAPKEDDD